MWTDCLGLSVGRVLTLFSKHLEESADEICQILSLPSLQAYRRGTYGVSESAMGLKNSIII